MSGGVEGRRGEGTGAEQSSDKEDDGPHPHELPDGTGSKPPEGSNKHKYLFACCSETHACRREYKNAHVCAGIDKSHISLVSRNKAVYLSTTVSSVHRCSPEPGFVYQSYGLISLSICISLLYDV